MIPSANLSAPKFGSAYHVLKYKRDGESVDAHGDQNRMLTRYLQTHSGYSDITEQPNGYPQRPYGGFTGAWLLLDDGPYILTDDQSGDHFSDAEKAFDQAAHSAEVNDMIGNVDGVEEAYSYLMQDMEEVTAKPMPIELEEITTGDRPGFRLNILSKWSD